MNDLNRERTVRAISNQLKSKGFTLSNDPDVLIDVVLTGRKWDKKNYYRHSGYIGGLKTITAKKLLEKKPEDLVRIAVKGMLPKNRLGSKLFKKLKVYAGNEHPHSAQQPEALVL